MPSAKNKMCAWGARFESPLFTFKGGNSNQCAFVVTFRVSLSGTCVIRLSPMSSWSRGWCSGSTSWHLRRSCYPSDSCRNRRSDLSPRLAIEKDTRQARQPNSQQGPTQTLQLGAIGMPLGSDARIRGHYPPLPLFSVFVSMDFCIPTNLKKHKTQLRSYTHCRAGSKRFALHAASRAWFFTTIFVLALAGFSDWVEKAGSASEDPPPYVCHWCYPT